jgi:hypothetical protein
MSQLLIFVLPLVALVVVVRIIVLMKASRAFREQQASATELQSFLRDCVEELDQLLSQEGIDRDRLRQDANAILAKMESRNSAGNLDAFIRDNRESVDLALARRDAS